MSKTISEAELNEIIEHENAHWSKIFSEEKRNLGKELFSSYWWEDYYYHMLAIVRRTIKDKAEVAEIGSGSGKASLLLGDGYRKHLVDISPPAIEFAKYLAQRLRAQNTSFEICNGFHTGLRSKSYDFTWNIGVIEHYSEKQAAEFVAEMLRITRIDEYIGIAVPNFKSFHIKKARLLNRAVFRRVSGYRLDSENNYPYFSVKKILSDAATLSGREITSIEKHRIGNPLPMGTPRFLLRTLGRMVDKILPGRRFLLLVMVKVH